MTEFLQSLGAPLLIPFFVGIIACLLSLYHFARMLPNRDPDYETTADLIGPFSFLFSLYWNETGRRHRRWFLAYFVIFLICLWVVVESGAFEPPPRQ
jgi:hypothetical protein